ncbi:MAG: IS1380 family transposase [Dehalococcoidia bacterium]
MGDSQVTLFQPNFNRSVHVEARADRLSADTGALLLRELMDRLGLTRLLLEHLEDPRDAALVTHPFEELLRTQLLLLAQGWSRGSDVALLGRDPTLRLAISKRRSDHALREAVGREPEGLCSQATLSRLLAILSSAENRDGLRNVLLDAAERRYRTYGAGRLAELTLDMDSLPLVVHGHQAESDYNGHYKTRCYHPLLVRSDRGDYLGARLRSGNVHTADGGLDFVLPILRWAKCQAKRVWLRIDAGFPEPNLLTALDTEKVDYVARLRGNTKLNKLAAPYLRRPPGRPPLEGRTWLHELSYGAKSWGRERRVVLVVIERPGEQGHLFLDHFFLLTSATKKEMDGKALLEHYRQRGTAEADFGAWQNALEPALSSTTRPKTHYREQEVQVRSEAVDAFATNEARLLLSLLAANLLHAGAELCSRAERQAYSRQRFRRAVLKASSRILLGKGCVTVVLDAARAALWTGVWTELQRTYPTRGSPGARALPTPA